MRIGTWNLQGRWDARHLDVIQSARCEIWLLTEVSDRVEIPGLTLHPTNLLMAERRHWAAVAASAPLQPLPDPHGASAMAEIDGLRVCSSVLPWKGGGTGPPWTGSSTAERTASAVGAIATTSPVIWGGDWNDALIGPNYSASRAGRQSILETTERLGLQVITESAPHQISGLLTIDHVAVPTSWRSLAVEHHRALVDGARISDHDAYVVDVTTA